MTKCIAFDLARLFIGPMTSTPRGIDRVDLAYARHFFEQWNGDCFGVLPTPWGVRWFNRDRSLRVVNFVEDIWGETAEPQFDPAYRWLKDKLLCREPSVALPKQQSGATRLLGGFVQFLRRHGFSLGHRMATLPPGTVYFNTGQIALTVPLFLKWLASRADIKPVFMLQDVIPIENPEYTSRLTSRAHEQMLESTARHARGLIVTTQAAAEKIARELARLNVRSIPMIARPLPVSPQFLKPAAPDPDLRDIAYFVICGPIEPRKNHLLLLNAWRELAARGQDSPRLVIIGSRWRTNNAVTDMLERCTVLRNFVVEVAGLSTPALLRILSGARALLMPSFAEGFGMPIIEALAIGTPVIASDIAAHREAGGSFATYLSPIDGLGWLRAIKSHSTDPYRSAPRQEKQYQPQSATDYFPHIEHFIGSL
jgi:glycosyltransferase involved in cell wall biosynthesis